MGESDYSVKVNRQRGSSRSPLRTRSGSPSSWTSWPTSSYPVERTLRRLPCVSGNRPWGRTARRSSRRRRGPATTTRARGGGRKPKVDEELRQQLTAEVRKKLEAFRAEREPNFESRQDQAAIIATFLQDELGLNGIDPRQLYTVYSIMGWPALADTRSLIKDARRRSGYFSGGVDGRAPLSSKGENFGRHHSKEPKRS